MTPAIIWGFGQLGAALATAVATSGDLSLRAVIDTDPAAVTRVEASARDLGAKIKVSTTLAHCVVPAPAIVFHATTSAPSVVTEQVLSALGRGYTVISAAEWLFHPWLRFGREAAALDAAARASGVHVIGCGINPGFSFEALPLLLSRTVHDIRTIDVLRVSNVGGIGPSDFIHLGFGLTPDHFAAEVAAGSISGHMGFPESVAALAERLPLPIDRITDQLEPTLATRSLDLPYRTIHPGEVVGITQTAAGFAKGEPRIRFTLDMFLDTAGYGRVPHERIDIAASRSFRVDLQPAASPAAGAAAVMVQAAAALASRPPGLISLLDLPLSGEASARLRAVNTTLSPTGLDLTVRTEPAGFIAKD